MSKRPIKVFFAYAREDDQVRDELVSQFATLINNGHIELWHDRKILPSMNFNEEINDRLTEADLFMPLISADFLNSDYCMGIEFRQARAQAAKGRTRILPVIVRPSMWELEPDLATLQVLPKDGKAVELWENKDSALYNVGIEVARLVNAIQKQPAPAKQVSQQQVEGKPQPKRKPPKPSHHADDSQATRQMQSAEVKRKFLHLVSKAAIVVLAFLAGLFVGEYGAGLLLASQGVAESQKVYLVNAMALGAGVLFSVLSLVIMSTLPTRRNKVKGKAATADQSVKDRSGRINWRRMAHLQHARKEMYKSAHISASQRLVQRRAMFWVALLIAMVHLGAVFGQSWVWEERRVSARLSAGAAQPVSEDIQSQPEDAGEPLGAELHSAPANPVDSTGDAAFETRTVSLQAEGGAVASLGKVAAWELQFYSIMLITLTPLVSAVIFFFYRRNQWASQGIWPAFFVGGFGAFFAGACFLTQLSPELWDSLAKGSDGRYFGIIPGLDYDWLKFRWLSYVLLQKLVLLPLLAILAAMAMIPITKTPKTIAA